MRVKFILLNMFAEVNVLVIVLVFFYYCYFLKLSLAYLISDIFRIKNKCLFLMMVV